MKILQALFVGLSLLIAGCSTVETDKQNAKAASINIRLGLAYLKQNRYEIASAKLKRALKAEPGSSKAHWAYALLQEKVGDFEQAETYYRKAIQLNDSDAEAFNNYGAFLCKRARPYEGIESFEKAIAHPLYSRKEVAYTNAGICLLRSGDMAKAERYFRAGLEISPIYSPGLYQMAMLMQQQARYLVSRAYRQRLKSALKRDDPKVLLLCVQTERAMSNTSLANECEAQLKSKYPASEEATSLY